MKPTLLIPAAGMGSRYGGLKQIDSMGPCGETLMDYSIYDAIRAGFGKVVFVIRHDFEKEFRNIFSVRRFGGQIEVDYVFQSLDKIPAPFRLNPERTKPWGANHAMLMAADLIHEPFAVVNSDDFYGAESFTIMADFLHNCNPIKSEYCMAGFRLGNTLSETGGVSRAVCSLNKDNTLLSIKECHQIVRNNSQIQYINDDGVTAPLEHDTIVSMNLWGFTPGFFRQSENLFVEFLEQNINDVKAEIQIPYVVGKLVESHNAIVHVKETSSEWFGVTWPQDRDAVVKSLKLKVDKGEYPENLWAL